MLNFFVLTEAAAGRAEGLCRWCPEEPGPRLAGPAPCEQPHQRLPTATAGSAGQTQSCGHSCLQVNAAMYGSRAAEAKDKQEI